MDKDEEQDREIEIMLAQQTFYLRLAAILAAAGVALVAILAIWGH